MPVLEARERLKELEVINANSIYRIHFTAFGNHKAAQRLQDQWMMQESQDSMNRNK